MKTCPPSDHLSGLLDGRLDPETTADVSAHLERCRACRTTIEELSAEPACRRWAELRAETISLGGPAAGFLGRLQYAVQKRSSHGDTSIARVAGGADGPPVPAGHTAPPGYEILGYLGRGGMGVVYKARHLALKRVVALKMLRPETVADADQRARLIGEAETVARLHHPNVAQVYEIGEQDGVPYLALEYVEGPTLSQVMDGKPHPPRVVAGLVATLARAAHHAHTLGVVHRDLKPGNILLKSPPSAVPSPQSGDTRLGTGDWGLGTPKITDFGLAKRLDETGQTLSGQVLGTPSYMAPEQARGTSGDVTPLADVYALGAILYELLTGRPPLVGLTTLDTVIRVLNEDPTRPRVLNAAVPADLETVCLKCLEKDPRRRYASAAALADDLDRFLAGTPVLARPLSRPVRAWRWARRHPTTAALLAVMLAVAAVGFPAATALWLDARESGARARGAEDEAVRARTAIARQSANLLAERGFALTSATDIGPGLLWLAEALRVCPTETEEDEAFRAVIRVNLTAYVPCPARSRRWRRPTSVAPAFRLTAGWSRPAITTGASASGTRPPGRPSPARSGTTTPSSLSPSIRTVGRSPSGTGAGRARRMATGTAGGGTSRPVSAWASRSNWGASSGWWPGARTADWSPSAGAGKWPSGKPRRCGRSANRGGPNSPGRGDPVTKSPGSDSPRTAGPSRSPSAGVRGRGLAGRRGILPHRRGGRPDDTGRTVPHRPAGEARGLPGRPIPGDRRRLGHDRRPAARPGDPGPGRWSRPVHRRVCRAHPRRRDGSHRPG